MITAFNHGVTVGYSLKSDTSEPKTIFQLGYFDTFLRGHLNVMLSGVYNSSPENRFLQPDELARWQQFIIELIRYGLRGWKNFTAPDGKTPLELKTEEITLDEIGTRAVVSRESLMHLRPEHLLELGTKIMEMNFGTKDSAKN